MVLSGLRAPTENGYATNQHINLVEMMSFMAYLAAFHIEFLAILCDEPSPAAAFYTNTNQARY